MLAAARECIWNDPSTTLSVSSDMVKIDEERLEPLAILSNVMI